MYPYFSIFDAFLSFVLIQIFLLLKGLSLIFLVMYIYWREDFQSSHVWKCLFHLHFWKTIFWVYNSSLSLYLSELLRGCSTVLLFAVFPWWELLLFSFFHYMKVSFLPLTGFRIFLFVTSFEQFDCAVPRCYFLIISYAWSLLRFLDLCIHVVQMFLPSTLGNIGNTHIRGL